MNIAFSKDTQLKCCHATLRLGTNLAEGRLTLTDYLLHFETNNKQLGLGSYAIKLATIAHVEKSTEKALGLKAVNYSSIKITTEQNHNIEFIVAEPDEWLDSLTYQATS